MSVCNTKTYFKDHVKVNTVYQNYVGTVIQGYTNTPKRCGFLNLRTGIRV